MGFMGRPKADLVLTEAEKEVLERWARRPLSPQSLGVRSRIVLACAGGGTNGLAAEEVGVSVQCVGKWRKRFVDHRLDGLSDEPRPGAVRKVSDDAVEALITKTLGSKPIDASHWSCRSMANSSGISASQVGRIWRTFGLKPHLVDSFKLSPDPLFVDKVRDIVGVYVNPPDAALVLCVDEKSGIQALDRTAPMFPMRPGVPARQTHDYKRNGTTNLYAALDVASGKVISTLTTRHRAVEFRKFLDKIDTETPKELDVHIILDNVATHKTELIKRWLISHPRFHFHFTPTYSSWMNLVERWFGELTTKWLTRSTHKSRNDLNRSIQHWIKTWNENPRPFVWHKTADQILESLSRYMHTFSGTGH
jgi:transposase